MLYSIFGDWAVEDHHDQNAISLYNNIANGLHGNYCTIPMSITQFFNFRFDKRFHKHTNYYKPKAFVHY